MKPLQTFACMTSTLVIHGPDACTFAHAQFTSNVQALVPGQWQWSAWLDARGRVQFLFHLARTDEHTLVALLRGGDAARMAEGLRRYVFRSRVTLESGAPAILGQGPSLPAHRIDTDGRSLAIGLDDHRLVFPGAPDDPGAWRLQAIRRGEPWLPDSLLCTLLPPALGLRRLGALSLDKGCFPGQEMAARLHYRGGHKHVLVHMALPQPVHTGPVSIEAGMAIERTPENIVQVLDCMPAGKACEALAVVHERLLDRLRATVDANRDGMPEVLQVFDA